MNSDSKMVYRGGSSAELRLLVIAALLMSVNLVPVSSLACKVCQAIVDDIKEGNDSTSVCSSACSIVGGFTMCTSFCQYVIDDLLSFIKARLTGKVPHSDDTCVKTSPSVITCYARLL